LPGLEEFVRIACLVVGAGLLIFGAYCGWIVFGEVGQVVTAGAEIEKAHGKFAELIHVESMTWEDKETGQKWEAGPTIAMLLVFLWYLVRAAIALMLIKAGTAVLLGAFRDRKR
jgi:hypothetical protein